MGVDPGEKHIGIALANPTIGLAKPLMIIKHISRAENAARIVKLAEENHCGAIVIGCPTDSDGQEGVSARRSLRLINAIREISSIELIPWDESHTSQDAMETLIASGAKKKNRQKRLDDLSAAMLLIDYMASLNLGSHNA